MNVTTILALSLYAELFASRSGTLKKLAFILSRIYLNRNVHLKKTKNPACQLHMSTSQLRAALVAPAHASSHSGDTNTAEGGI